MKRTTTYLDAFASGLVPVKYHGPGLGFFGDTDPTMVQVEVTADRMAYRKGEILNVSRYVIVVKTGQRGYHEMVRTATDEELGIHA